MDQYLATVEKKANKFYASVDYGVCEGTNMENLMDEVYELLAAFTTEPFDVVFDTSNIKGELF